MRLKEQESGKQTSPQESHNSPGEGCKINWDQRDIQSCVSISIEVDFMYRNSAKVEHCRGLGESVFLCVRSGGLMTTTSKLMGTN